MMLVLTAAVRDETEPERRSVSAVVMNLSVVAVALAVKNAVTEQETLIANAADGVMSEVVLAVTTKNETVNATRKPVRLYAARRARARNCDAESGAIVMMDPLIRVCQSLAVTMPMRMRVVFVRRLQWEHHRLHLPLRRPLSQVMKAMHAAGDLVETDQVDLTIEIVNASAGETAAVTETTAKVAAARPIASAAVQTQKTVPAVMGALEGPGWATRTSVPVVGREMCLYLST